MPTLLDPTTGETVPSSIMLVKPAELPAIQRSHRFAFDWRAEKGALVYKMVKQEDQARIAQGLLSLTDIPQELRVHINLVENANENKGDGKLMDRVAGCLIAFAVRLAFEKGYAGFVSLLPKTSLIPLYIKKYGFVQYGRNLATSGSNSIRLVKQYLI